MDGGLSMNRSDTRSSWWIKPAFLLCVFLVMMVLMRVTASHVANLSEGQGIIDLTFGIPPEQVRAALTRYTPAAVMCYRYLFLSVDLVYALSYVSFYRCAIRAILTKVGAGRNMLAVMTTLPVIGMTADLFENTALFLLLGQEDISELLCMLFTVFNIIKFLFVYSSLAIVIGGLVCLIKKRLS